jgi:DNA-binding NarL/FixJ family response regulator
VTLLWVERFEAVEAMLTAMLAEAERSGSTRGLHNTYVTLGLLKLLLGALPEADAAARVALRVQQAGDFGEGLSLVVSVLAEVAVEAGDLGGAEAVLDMVKVGELPPTVSALRMRVARARLLMAYDRPAEALAELEACRFLFKPRLRGVALPDNGFPQLRSRCAQALLRLDRREEARELVNSELADARAFGAPRALGVALRVSGLVHGGEEGLRLLQESVAVLRQSPAMLERAHSLAELGAALRRAGRRTEARAPLAEALELAARCGARPLAARAREELQATGARPRREWRTGVEALTPSELRVARLAAEGMTNREIAQTLYVTLKTVEAHLASTYGKLAIAGRSELMLGLEGRKLSALTP